ncbi:MFS transporter [Reyranella soli]|uniref:ABC transporter permease n=1 Tax=Reyranella soli TaxID=1230389 RepID=A0A512NI97_9HYPH|nr:MFS transporter [Reyranella soli]GEP58678.1 ABC transporter permease [Reyranella soli]
MSRVRLFPETADANARRLVAARGLRALVDGYVSILLPAYLLALGLDSFEVGVLATATLLGSASLALCVGFLTSHFGHRRPLLAAATLMMATGCAFAGVQGFWPLLLVAFVGTLNPSSGDVSVFLPLEHSLLAQSVGDRDRTALYVRYSLAGSLMGAAGTLFAVLPALTAEWLDVSPLRIMQGLFLLYAAIGLANGLIYRQIDESRVPQEGKPSAPLGPSRAIVYRLAALFCIDSFSGGLIVQSMLALWLFQTFGLSVAAAANLFFWTSICSAVSMFAAVPLANRIGLVRTMVFTHLPSSLCLVVIPFVSDLFVVIALLVVRSLLSQMDVPTRNSYVMAVVTPPERPAAASVTSVPRSLASAIGPVIAGYLFLLSGFGWPLLLAGILKSGYDLALLALFSHVRPPEEREAARAKAATSGG